MNFGIVIGRIGGVDGVALETEKWIDILKEMGHKVYVIAGEFEGRARKHKEYASHFPMMSFFSPECTWEQDNAFFRPSKDPEPVLESIERDSELIARILKGWIKSKKIDVLISQNASALPSHLSMGLGIKKVVEQTGMPTITHDHDFHWERGDRYTSPHREVNELVDEVFPLRMDNVHNAVINSYNQNNLKDKYGTEATLVPNVMDFSKPYARPSKKSEWFIRDLGVMEGEIPLFQITRVVRRKGIETAIRLVHLLDDKKIKLVITGNHNDDEGAQYFRELVDLIHDLKLLNQVLFADKMITNRKELEKAYASARACTYFSTYEGFGNAFVECALARRPIFVNNYEPVFWPDIGSKGFKLVMLENNELESDKVEEMKNIVYDTKLCKEIGDHNYEVAEEHFSYDVLRNKLQGIIDSFA